MLLTISESNDLSTDKVIEWLIKEGFFAIKRINESNSIIINRLCLNNIGSVDIQLTNSANNTSFSISDVSFFWYRRGNLSKGIFPIVPNEMNKHLLKFLNWEWKICVNFIVDELQSKKSLGDLSKSNVNKLKNLQIAVRCGLIIPPTIISEYNLELENSNSEQLITKPISEAMTIADESSYLDLKTTVVNGSYEFFFPSLCQEKIEKWIELRVFVSYDEIYAMAIFSQGNQKTAIDFRNYDEEKRNRFVPFQLPENIKKKIFHFMDEVGLDTGSIDLILTPEKEYVFLEINPAGNIEMVSEPCNYYIEKRIAEQILERMPS